MPASSGVAFAIRNWTVPGKYDVGVNVLVTPFFTNLKYNPSGEAVSPEFNVQFMTISSPVSNTWSHGFTIAETWQTHFTIKQWQTAATWNPWNLMEGYKQGHFNGASTLNKSYYRSSPNFAGPNQLIQIYVYSSIYTSRKSSLTSRITSVHYSDVIMSTMMYQITGVSTVCLTVCSVADQRKHPGRGESTGDRWIALTKGQ